MQKTLTYPAHSEKPNRLMTMFVKAIILLGLTLFTYDYFRAVQLEKARLEMSSGKNGKHTNPKAQKSAEEHYKKAKEAFDNLSKKPKKTKGDNKSLEKLKKQVQRWRQKKDWSGENHSQKHKGN